MHELSVRIISDPSGSLLLRDFAQLLRRDAMHAKIHRHAFHMKGILRRPAYLLVGLPRPVSRNHRQRIVVADLLLNIGQKLDQAAVHPNNGIPVPVSQQIVDTDQRIAIECRAVAVDNVEYFASALALNIKTRRGLGVLWTNVLQAAGSIAAMAGTGNALVAASPTAVCKNDHREGLDIVSYPSYRVI